MTEVMVLDSITVRRSGATLIDGVSWTVNEGERWVVIGPNGAGKSTLIHVVAGRNYPTSGTVSVLGEVFGMTDLSELRQRIGLSSAILAEALPPGESVLDVVVTASWATTGRWREEYAAADLSRAHALLIQMGISDLAGRTFGTLSEGERKRVQIARSLMPDPELLILDEPAAGLDLGAREDLVGRLGLLASDSEGPAMILVTHHVEEIPRGFTHCLIIARGRAVNAGPIKEVLTSEALSRTYGIPIEVVRDRGRWTARGRLSD